jgi:uncharacterized alkaline shock family protein YloU
MAPIVPPGQELEHSWESLRPARGADAGQVQIGDDVIARIIEIATGEIEGVSLESKFALADLIGRKDKEPVKGITIERADDASVAVAVSVRMAYGKDMYDLAVRLQRHVKATVEKMTRVVVARIDVRIVGIIIERERPATANTPLPEVVEERS